MKTLLTWNLVITMFCLMTFALGLFSADFENADYMLMTFLGITLGSNLLTFAQWLSKAKIFKLKKEEEDSKEVEA